MRSLLSSGRRRIRLFLLRILLRYRRWQRFPRSGWARSYQALLRLVWGSADFGTLDLQRVLPRLPVPPLGQTCRSYLASLRLLQTAAEFSVTQSTVASFQRPGGTGEQLQAALLAKASDADNYLDSWWEGGVLLGPRKPLFEEINWYMVGDPEPSSAGQAVRAAQVVCGLLDFRDQINSATLRPERLYGAVPLCMRQYSRLFATTKVPGLVLDALVTYSPDESRHIVVLCKHQFYCLDVVREDGSRWSVRELTEQFEAVMVAATNGRESPIGVLTSTARALWAELRSQLMEHNAEALATIEKALFILCLDECACYDLDELARAGLHGDARNRWFDKSFQVIIPATGQIALYVDHACADGTVGASLFEAALSCTAKPLENEALPARPVSPIRGLRWHLTPGLQKALLTGERDFERLVSNLDLKVLVVPDLGQTRIKRWQLSPDGFAQAGMQFAHHRLHGWFAATYESAQMRQFLHGRTEGIRSCSADIIEFVRAMERRGESMARRYALLQRATDAHAQTARRVMIGMGVERHLMALRLVAFDLGLEPPSIFQDQGYRLGWRLSTSHARSAHSCGAGFWPVADDGYGIGYCVSDSSMYFHITSIHSCRDTSSADLAATLATCLAEMRDVCIRANAEGNSIENRRSIQWRAGKPGDRGRQSNAASLFSDSLR